MAFLNSNEHFGGSSLGLWLAIGYLFALAALYLTAIVIYNLYFHPLRKYPGPKILAASRLQYVRWMFQGSLAPNWRRLHEQYGKIVRTAPNELSYTDPEAWKTIYGHHQQGEGFRKNPIFNETASNGVHSILTAEGETHRRMRRALAHAFSDRALQEQGDILQHFTNLLIRRLREEVSSTHGSPVDLFQWYNWTTFDLIGDLSFGEPFYCLEKGQFSDWVAMVYNSFKTIAFLNISKNLAPLDKVAKMLIPKSMKAKKIKLFMGNSGKVDHRLASKTDRHDFLSYIIKNNDSIENDNSALAKDELYANSTLLVLAGSESTASVLSAMTFFILKSPLVLRKATDEIRSAFKTESEITLSAVKELPYLAAVVSEALRMYPPFPEGLPRIAPREGAMICGEWVPAGTFVQISHYAIQRSFDNFTHPDSFAPERWLGDAEFAADNKEAAQPFSVGPRSCIGRNLAYLEMRLITANMLWNFDMELSAESLEWDSQASFIQWDKKPLLAKLSPVVREQKITVGN